MKKIGEGIYIDVSPEKIIISKSISMWNNIILLIGCIVSLIYWRNIYLITGIILLTILSNFYRKHIHIDFKNKTLHQYSNILLFKYLDKKQTFTSPIKFEVRKEEFGDADMGLRNAYVLYFISDFEKGILQFDFSGTGKKLLTILLTP